MITSRYQRFGTFRVVKTEGEIIIVSLPLVPSEVEALKILIMNSGEIEFDTRGH